MRKGNLLLWFGLLVITLPCFARAFRDSVYQQSFHSRLSTSYTDIYSATLLAPVSVDQTDYGSWDMNFEGRETFDIIRFASTFNSEGYHAILGFILDQMEMGDSSYLIDHPLVVPVWVSGESKIKLNDWVRVVQNSSAKKTGWLKIDSSSKFKVRDRGDDFISEFYCSTYEPPLIGTLSDLSSSRAEEYAIAAKLPPFPIPVPPPLPRLAIKMDDVDAGVVKMNNINSKTSVSFSMVSGHGNRLPLVSYGDSSNLLSAWSVISNGEIQRENFPMELYFVVVSVVTPEKKRLFRELLLEEFQFQTEKGVGPSYEKDYGTECELKGVAETAFVAPSLHRRF